MAALALLVMLPAGAEARSRRRATRNPVRVVLQPFLVAHAVVHTVATAPLRVAFQSAARRAPVYDAEIVDEAEREPEEPEAAAYFTGRVPHPAGPHRERGGMLDESEEDQPRQAGNRGGRPVVSGNRAVLRGGVAYAPANAPESVKRAIWAANGLRGKPYVWGGGHGSFQDRGYDCSGTVSFALHHAGVLPTPLPSSDFLRYGERGRGRWVTIYARPGHTFAVIAGLRLDTTDFRRGGNVGPRWHAEGRDPGGFAARHPAGL